MLLCCQESVVSWILPNPWLEAALAVRLAVQDEHFNLQGRVTTWHTKIAETWVLTAPQEHECIFFFLQEKGEKEGGECSVCSRQKSHCAVKLYIHIRNLKPVASRSRILVTVNKITLPTILSFCPRKKRERPSTLCFWEGLTPHDGLLLFLISSLFWCFWPVVDSQW